MRVHQDRIAVVAFDGGSLFELSGPLGVFRQWWGEGRAWEVGVCSGDPGPLRTSAGLRLTGLRSLRWMATAEVVIVPTWPHPGTPPPVAVIRALQQAHRRGATVVGLCLGAFVVAATGLLDGRRATTHWAHLDQLAALHPDVTVIDDQLYVDEGSVLTSAGSAAGIDCCLHLVRRMEGAEQARRMARALVVAPHREGDQRQFGDPGIGSSPGGEHDLLRAALDTAAVDPSGVRNVDDLAAAAAMSRRSFERRFAAEYGTSPARWLLARRIDRARSLLETTHAGLDEVAVACGFGSTATMRSAFREHLAISPSDYRARFAERV